MKKLLVMILALCMLCSVAFANDLSWSEVEEAASKVAGEFKTFDEISVKIWIPDVLQALELSDEDRESGLIGYYTTEDGTAAVSVRYVNVDGTTLEEYAAWLQNESDVSGIEAGVVNGLPALTYELKEKDTGCIAFTTQMGYILEVSCAPMSDEGFSEVAAVIISSIQAAE